MPYPFGDHGERRMTDQGPSFRAPMSPSVSSWFGFFPEFRKDSLGFLLHCHQYGNVVKLPMGRLAALLLRQHDPAIYLLTHPDDIRHVLVTNQANYTKAPVPPVESKIFGTGVLHSEGEQHHQQRRLFLPFFHSDHVTSFTGLITAQAARQVESWPDGATIDIGYEMTRLTLTVICRFLFGEGVDLDTEELVATITTGQELIKLQYDSVLARVTPLWVPTRLRREFARRHRRLDAVIRRTIRERRSAPTQDGTLLAFLLSATDGEGCPLDDEQIRDHLMTFLLAGHETTANALTWTWLLLSQWKTARTTLAQEVQTVLGGHLPGVTDMAQLRYTTMIWEETLRLYPPAWLLHTRLCLLADRLPSGMLLPQGSRVFISPWSLHRNSRWFPDANRFDPDRFSEEAKRSRPSFTYLPFGAGGRRCLGESFANLEGVLILATVASRVQLRLVEGQTIRPNPLMTLRPDAPVWMTVHSVSDHEAGPNSG